MRLNLRIPISLTGLAVAAVAIGGYHHFVEPLFPATGMDLFWIVYAVSGFNLYGYFFRFRSLVQPSTYRERYRDAREMASWTWTKLKQNRHLPAKYGRKAVREEPFSVAFLTAWAFGFAVQQVFNTLTGFVLYAAVLLAFLVNEYRDFTNTSEEGGTDD